MEDIIHDLHMDYNDVPITGLFLVYPTCYIHVLEVYLNIQYLHYLCIILYNIKILSELLLYWYCKTRKFLNLQLQFSYLLLILLLSIQLLILVEG